MTRIAFEVLTLFPELITDFVAAGLLGKAIERGIVAVYATDIRAFAEDKHRTVDDTPFGGGAGMVMKPEPVVAALDAVQAERGPMHRILLTPSAPRFDQQAAARLAELPRVALVCGRYEGIDDRVREHFIDECLSLGDFVLSGGEVAALAIIEAVGRLAGGFMGNPDSAASESFARDDRGALLEYPQYTRPAVFRGHAVPDVLLGGDHSAIAAWRRRAARLRTWALRPDLRPPVVLPETVRWHFATRPHPGLANEIAALARAHQLAGVVLLGADPESVVVWTQAAGGQTSVTAFRDLRTLRRKLRQRSGGRVPRLLALVEEPSHPGALTEPEAVREALLAEEEPRDIVIVVADACPDPELLFELADAVFAPPSSGQPLAFGPGIAEASRPPSPAVMLAHRGFERLRARTDPIAAIAPIAPFDSDGDGNNDDAEGATTPSPNERSS